MEGHGISMEIVVTFFPGSLCTWGNFPGNFPGSFAEIQLDVDHGGSPNHFSLEICRIFVQIFEEVDDTESYLPIRPS